jgi:hypothetical protein
MRDGFSVDLFDLELDTAVVELPAPYIEVVRVEGSAGKDGRDADYAEIEQMIELEVANLPRAKDGKDGKSVERTLSLSRGRCVTRSRASRLRRTGRTARRS